MRVVLNATSRSPLETCEVRPVLPKPKTARLSSSRSWRASSGASVAIVATPAIDELVLVRQYRHPAGTSLWEIPAGTCEPGETLIDGAGRELREETGFSAGRLTKIGSLWTTPGFCSEVMHFFHAEELVEGVTDFDDDERIEVGRFTQQAAWRLVVNGAADAKTVLALFWLEGGRGKIGSHVGR